MVILDTYLSLSHLLLPVLCMWPLASNMLICSNCIVCHQWCCAVHVCNKCDVCVVCRLIPIEELSVGQIFVLKKLSLIKLTALIELYKAKSNM